MKLLGALLALGLLAGRAHAQNVISVSPASANSSITPSTVTISNLGSGRVVYTQTGGVLASSPTFVVSPAGNIGIGTASPAQKIHMSSGTLLIDGNTASSIKTTGTVQIGTTTATNTFDAVGTGITLGGIHTSSIAGARLSGTAYYDGNDVFDFEVGQTQGSLLGSGTDGPVLRGLQNEPMTFWTNNSEKVRIQADGNVGIGTVSPGALLDVKSTFTVANSGIISGPSQPGVSLHIASTANCKFQTDGSRYPVFWTLGSAPDYSTQNMFDQTNSSDAITIPVGGSGVYSVDCMISFTAGGNGTYRETDISINSNAFARYNTTYTTTASNIGAHANLYLNAGDVLRCKGATDSTVQIGCQVGSATGAPTWFTVQKLW